MSYAEQTVPMSVTGAPAWFAALPDRQWTRVARGTGGGAFDGGATIYQVRPSPLPSGISPVPFVFSYSGGCVDQSRGWLLVHGGGHGDYAGNEVYALKLREAQPTWECIANPSPGALAPNNPSANGPGQYSADFGINGYPAGSHTSNNLVFANDRMWLPRVWGMYPLAPGTPRIFSFDVTERRWRAHGYWRTAAEASRGGNIESQPSFYLPLDDLVVTGATNYTSPAVPIMVAINARTGAIVKSWTDQQVYPGMQAAKAVVIPGTRLAVLIHTYDTTFQVLDFASSPPSQSAATVTDNSGVSGWRSEVQGAVYHAASNSIICHAAGEDLVVLGVPTNPRTGPWVARKVRPANVADGARLIPAPASHNYHYGRFNIVNDMGDGRSALVWQPSDPTLGAYMMPLPAGALP